MVFDRLQQKSRRNVPERADGNRIRAVLKPRIEKAGYYGD